MRVFALSDLHLGLAVNKPMDIFGDVWIDHPARITQAWRAAITDGDLVLIPGDLSWARRLVEAHADLAFVGRLPGRKIMTKGNHDLWWDTTSKVAKACPPGVVPVLNSCVLDGDIAVAAIRGWDFPGSPDFDAEQEKVYFREVGRLELALEAARQLAGRYRILIAMLHYPPLLDPTAQRAPASAVRSGFIEPMLRAGVTLCAFGHVHGPSLDQVVEGDLGGIRYVCASADHLEMQPKLVLEI